MGSGEFDFIRKVLQCQPSIPEGIEGIGDDAAVIPVSDSESLVITADALVEDVHFRRDWASAYQIGRKSAAVNLSDVAAMGAEPVGLFLSFSVPSHITSEWRDEFISGIGSWGIPLLGGDTTSSPDRIYINITAVGKACNGNIRRRSTAMAGNGIYVTGNLGDSGAGLYVLQNSIQGYESLVAAHLDPRPMMKEGRLLGQEPAVTAMMDISDGLAGDILHILDRSGLSAVIDCDLIPMSDGMISLCNCYSLDPLCFALSAGEDYQLLFAMDEKNSLPLHAVRIGTLYEGNCGVRFEHAPHNASYKGYTHF